jgi:hypothetical protein
MLGSLAEGLKAPQGASRTDGGTGQKAPPSARIPPQMGPELANLVSIRFPTQDSRRRTARLMRAKTCLRGSERRLPGFYQASRVRERLKDDAGADPHADLFQGPTAQVQP